MKAIAGALIVLAGSVMIGAGVLTLSMSGEVVPRREILGSMALLSGATFALGGLFVVIRAGLFRAGDTDRDAARR